MIELEYDFAGSQPTLSRRENQLWMVCLLQMKFDETFSGFLCCNFSKTLTRTCLFYCLHLRCAYQWRNQKTAFVRLLKKYVNKFLAELWKSKLTCLPNTTTNAPIMSVICMINTTLPLVNILEIPFNEIYYTIKNPPKTALK